MVRINSPVRTALTGLSRGDQVQAQLQSLGMGQRAAAMQGALFDLSSGNLLGYRKNLMEATTGFDPGLARGRMMAPHSCHNPVQARKLGRVTSSHTYADAFGTSTTERRNLKQKGFLGKFRGKLIEKRLKRDPIFRAQFEAKVGGKVVFDGRNDGKITVRRFTPNLPNIAASAFNGLHGNIMANTALGGLAAMQGAAAQLMAQITGGASAGGGMNAMMAGAGGQYGVGGQGGQHSSSMSKGSGAAGSAVARLGPGAAFEDLVAAFMIDTVKDMQDLAKKKMDEIRNSMDSNKAGAGGAKNALPGGQGQFAAQSAALAAGGGAAGAAGAAGGAQGAAAGQGANSADSKGADSRNLMFEELKNIMQKVSQMQQALSNVLNTMHQGERAQHHAPGRHERRAEHSGLDKPFPNQRRKAAKWPPFFFWLEPTAWPARKKNRSGLRNTAKTPAFFVRSDNPLASWSIM
jgi:hypothetical protein